MSAMNFEQARHNMIEQQIRPWEVLDQQVLDLLARIPREEFVPAEYRNIAFTDSQIPLPHQQVMMKPIVEARLIQALQIGADDVVLEIGTGSGYVTALLASLAKHVYSVDIHEDFTNSAQSKLQAQGIRNVSLESGDAANGWEKHAPYDAIIITGSLPLLPKTYMQALKTGGRLCAIVGDSPAMDVMLITRVSENDWSKEYLFETDLPPLENAAEPERFVL